MDFLRIAVLNYKQLHLSEEGSGYMHMYVLQKQLYSLHFPVLFLI
ncbi:Uncharacterised protein [Streptococcus pneumoniae]|nr:Uncharacterised protein [Streptococcus pneumoniae]CJB52861.1 Uncharacterised protein [Streptococcus pneumoniae]CJB97505.1 Uncharacterised protein [Streptococcus pneumoniae]CJH36534.1 Uncharacterised protein [Streptococcus pneumoniae]CJJ23859.1 Uncharacterised protein [Streptococcus pneumoniae]